MINLSYCVYLLLMARLEEKRKAAARRTAEWRARNPGRSAAICKAYREKNPERVVLDNKKFREKNPDYLQRYKESHRKSCLAYNRRRWLKDPLFRVVLSMRNRIRQVLKGGRKAARSLELLGCSVPAFREHLEKQFQPGMTWENYGLRGWHVDHKRPCASFDLSDPEQQKACFHYTNLQPLWATENIKKGDIYGGC